MPVPTYNPFLGASTPDALTRRLLGVTLPSQDFQVPNPLRLLDALAWYDQNVVRQGLGTALGAGASLLDQHPEFLPLVQVLTAHPFRAGNPGSDVTPERVREVAKAYQTGGPQGALASSQLGGFDEFLLALLADPTTYLPAVGQMRFLGPVAQGARFLDEAPTKALGAALSRLGVGLDALRTHPLVSQLRYEDFTKPRFPYPEPGERFSYGYRGVVLPEMESLIDTLGLGSARTWESRAGNTYFTYDPRMALPYADPAAIWSEYLVDLPHGWLVQFVVPEHVQEWLLKFAEQPANFYQAVMPGNIPADLITNIGMVPRGMSKLIDEDVLERSIDDFVMDILGVKSFAPNFSTDFEYAVREHSYYPPDWFTPLARSIGVEERPTWVDYLKYLHQEGIPRSSFEEILDRALQARGFTRIIPPEPENTMVPKVGLSIVEGLMGKDKPLLVPSALPVKFGGMVADPLAQSRYVDMGTLWKPYDFPGEAGKGGGLALQKYLMSERGNLLHAFVKKFVLQNKEFRENLKYVTPKVVPELFNVLVKVQDDFLLGSPNEMDAIVERMGKLVSRPFVSVGVTASPALREHLKYTMMSLGKALAQAVLEARKRGELPPPSVGV